MGRSLEMLQDGFQRMIGEHPIASCIGLLIFFVICCIADKIHNSEKEE